MDRAEGLEVYSGFWLVILWCLTTHFDDSVCLSVGGWSGRLLIVLEVESFARGGCVGCR
jgi:hypothetical protein